jgi:Flp pilus assembly CpaF family ATPase
LPSFERTSDDLVGSSLRLRPDRIPIGRERGAEIIQIIACLAVAAKSQELHCCVAAGA